MVETVHLLPPDSGPRSDPRLFGVAQALSELFPVETPKVRRDGERDAHRRVETRPKAKLAA